LIKRILAVAALLLLLAGGAALGYVLYVRHESRDVRGSSTVEFTPSEPPAPPVTTTRPPPPPPPTTTGKKKPGRHPKPEPTPKPKPRPRPVLPGVVWPTFGYTAERTRFQPGSSLRPPFRRVWTWRGQSLLEFPPALAYGRAYIATNRGILVSLNLKTGRKVWRYVSHRCVAASPAIDGRLVVQTFLNAPPCNSTRSDQNGRVIAFDALTGKLRWGRTIGPSESSPLVSGGLVYVGDWRGFVYALDERTGRTRWTFRTGDKVKGAVAVSGRRLYVGSYDGKLYALGALTGHELWHAAGQPRLGAHGTFYSTPAAAYGRVYIGSTDGKVYSFGATSGKLRWSQSTGGFVYGSPAVWRERILVGSYDGTFYSLDAATGDVRWTFKANGPISGSATVLDGIVYFATLKRRTYALNAATGKLLWTFPDGKYSPIVADAEHVYLVGYTRLYALERLRPPARKVATPHRARVVRLGHGFTAVVAGRGAVRTLELRRRTRVVRKLVVRGGRFQLQARDITGDGIRELLTRAVRGGSAVYRLYGGPGFRELWVRAQPTKTGRTQLASGGLVAWQAVTPRKWRRAVWRWRGGRLRLVGSSLGAPPPAR